MIFRGQHWVCLTQDATSQHLDRCVQNGAIAYVMMTPNELWTIEQARNHYEHMRDIDDDPMPPPSDN